MPIPRLLRPSNALSSLASARSSHHTSTSVAVRRKSDAIGSTVDRGTRFENGTLQFLSRIFPTMDLIRTGGANDGGVDLLGWWNISSTTSNAVEKDDRVRVVVQCKAEAKKLGPIHVRELKGVVDNMLVGDRSGLAILASSSGFSKQCLMQGLSWNFPLLFLHLIAATPRQGLEDDAPPNCLSILPNNAFSTKLEEEKMEIKHIVSVDSKGQKHTTPAIFTNGKRH